MQLWKLVDIHMWELDNEQFIVMGTKDGCIKRTSMEAFKNTRKSGIIALELEENDELRFVALSDGNKTLLVSTKKGKAIRFDENDVRPMGRTARGVRSIRLAEGDEVVSMAVCDEDTILLTVTETGYGRRTPITDHRIQTRGGKGITNYRCEKYGDVCGVIAANDDEDINTARLSTKILKAVSEEKNLKALRAEGLLFRGKC